MNRTHGHIDGGKASPTYRTWRAMRDRCYKPKTAHYESYGGRGITVCDRWRDSFINFLADMGERPNGTTIDRLDSRGNYELANCRWATPREQATNRVTTHLVEYGGERLSISEWARQLGLSNVAVHHRLTHDWPISRALSPQKRQGQRLQIKIEAIIPLTERTSDQRYCRRGHCIAGANIAEWIDRRHGMVVRQRCQACGRANKKLSYARLRDQRLMAVLSTLRGR